MRAKVLDQKTVTLLNKVFVKEGQWLDGRVSAGGDAAMVKQNLQLHIENEQIYSLLCEIIGSQIRSHPKISNICQPAQISPLVISKMHCGGYYGTHSDFAIENRFRSDYSFTLFLSHPEDYTGGALQLFIDGEWQSVKLEVGELYLYPSGTLHRVSRVERGERVVIAGWIQSLYKDATQRSIMSSLAAGLEQLEENPQAGKATITQCQYNLQRMWGDLLGN